MKWKTLLMVAALSLAVCGCGKEETGSTVTPTSSVQATSTPTVAVTPTEALPQRELFEGPSEHKLSNPNATATAQKIYDYLCFTSGKHIISGQMESTWMESEDYEFEYVQEKTGKLPAMRGFDYNNGAYRATNQRIIEWWNKGGLVTVCWHTGINGFGYDRALSDEPDFTKLLDKTTDEHAKMIAAWKQTADTLVRLRDQGVVVLWRPFHNLNGAEYWWSKGTPEDYVALWRMMYDMYTNEYGLNNLIWVLGYTEEIDAAWYPGDEYCDIIGSSTHEQSTNAEAYKKLQSLSGEFKPIVLHECATMETIGNYQKDETIWGYFLTWHTESLTTNEDSVLQGIYNSEVVITYDELPAFH